MSKDQEAYKRGLISECKRVNAAFLKLGGSVYMPLKHFDKQASSAYKKYQYSKKLGITFNELKKMAGISVDRKRTRKPQIKKQIVMKNKGEFRICNMCENEFPKFENMHSCAICTRKKSGSGEFGSNFELMEHGL